MTAADAAYVGVDGWVKARLAATHRTVARTIGTAVRCRLAAQRMIPAALARALPAEQAGTGRARLTRVRRWWRGPPLDQARVSPALIRDALAVVPAGAPVMVAHDTLRLGGWAVIPDPWPRGRVRATTLARIRPRQAAFPPGMRWTLVADRGFPSAALVAMLRQDGTDVSAGSG